MKTQIVPLKSKVFSILFFLSFPVLAETKENEWKFNALYISNFARYIRWPDSSSQKIITVLGDNPVFNELVRISNLKSEEIKLVIRCETNAEDITRTHILFIPAERSKELPQIVKKFGINPVLIVTNKKGTILQGSCINLNNKYWKLRYEISTRTLQRNNLSADPQLFKLGKVID